MYGRASAKKRSQRGSRTVFQTHMGPASGLLVMNAVSCPTEPRVLVWSLDPNDDAYQSICLVCDNVRFSLFQGCRKFTRFKIPSSRTPRGLRTPRSLMMNSSFTRSTHQSTSQRVPRTKKSTFVAVHARRVHTLRNFVLQKVFPRSELETSGTKRCSQTRPAASGRTAIIADVIKEQKSRTIS